MRTEVFENGRSGVLEREWLFSIFDFRLFFLADDDDGRVSEIILLVSRQRIMTIENLNYMLTDRLLPLFFPFLTEHRTRFLVFAATRRVACGLLAFLYAENENRFLMSL